jgi:hypothetical protein
MCVFYVLCFSMYVYLYEHVWVYILGWGVACGMRGDVNFGSKDVQVYVAVLKC